MALNLKSWLKGLLVAAISGAGSSLAGSIVGLTWRQIGVMAAYSGLSAVGFYLKSSPLPEMEMKLSIAPREWK